MTLDIITIIPIAVSIAALVYTAVSFRKVANKDTSATAAAQATMTADIRYIRNAIDDIKLENRAIKKELDELKGRVIIAEQSIQSVQKQLNKE